MALSDTPIMGMLTQKMDWLSQRQRVIGQNIANADTPGYRAQEIEEIDFKRSMRRQQGQLQLAITDPSHLKSPGGSTTFRESRAGSAYEVAPAGNEVVLEEQMMKMSQNAGDYAFTTNLYRKYTGLYRMALGRSGG
jgi:flagellar basal-body rod protein FlgB